MAEVAAAAAAEGADLVVVTRKDLVKLSGRAGLPTGLVAVDVELEVADGEPALLERVTRPRTAPRARRPGGDPPRPVHLGGDPPRPVHLGGDPPRPLLLVPGPFDRYVPLASVVSSSVASSGSVRSWWSRNRKPTVPSVAFARSTT